MTSRAPLRVAIAGAGMVSRHHLIAWSKLPEATIVGIADPRRESAASRAAAFGIVEVHDDVVLMLDACRPDALDIAVPMAMHGELIALAAERGIPMLCQKPLAPTLAEAETIVAGLGDRVRLMVHENWRFRPHYRQIAGWLEAGAIGAPRAFRLETISVGLLTPADGSAPPALVRQPFLARLKRLIVWELLVHHLDVLGFLLGALRVDAASLAALSPHVKGEDTATIHLAAGPAQGVVFASMAAAGATPGDRLLLLGDRGAIHLDGTSLRLAGAVGDQSLELDLTADYQASYDATIAHFVDALIQGTPFETPPAVHLAVLEAAEAVYRCASGCHGRP